MGCPQGYLGKFGIDSLQLIWTKVAKKYIFLHNFLFEKMDGSTFFWSCLVSLWFFADMKFQVDWMGWVYRKLLRHTHKDTFTKSRDPELWRIFCWLVGAQPQPIASNLQASFLWKMGMFCSSLSTSWIEIPPYFTTFINRFWDDSSLNAFGHSVPRVPPGDDTWRDHPS